MKQPRRRATATPYEQYDLTRGPVNKGVFTHYTNVVKTATNMTAPWRHVRRHDHW